MKTPTKEETIELSEVTIKWLDNLRFTSSRVYTYDEMIKLLIIREIKELNKKELTK